MKSIFVIILEIKWTKKAQLSFEKNISYLQKEWSEKEVERFVNRTDNVLLLLSRYPEIGCPTLKRKNIRLFVLNKTIQLIYHYKPTKKQIEVLLFWNTKQHPSKFNF